MRGIRLSLLCALLACSSMMARSQAASSRNDWVSDLRGGRSVIVFRHGATTSDQTTDAMSNPKADPMSNPSGSKAAAGERQLNEAGRARAQSIGASLRKLGIPVGMVLTSPLRRAVDTGMLMAFGEVTIVPDLAEAGPALSPEENRRRAQRTAHAGYAASPGRQQSRDLVAQAEHDRCIRQGLVRPSRRRGLRVEPDGQGAFRLIVRVPADASTAPSRDRRDWSRCPRSAPPVHHSPCGCCRRGAPSGRSR